MRLIKFPQKKELPDPTDWQHGGPWWELPVYLLCAAILASVLGAAFRYYSQ